MECSVQQYEKRIEDLAEVLRKRLPRIPDTAVILGSGLGRMVDRCSDRMTIPYAELEGFPVPTVSGHQGQLIYGIMGKKPVLALQGRFHYYEGWEMHEVLLPVRVLARLGVRTLILTNAAGGLDPNRKPGSFLVLSDHIGLFCPSPLRGPNLDSFGPRFPDCSSIYTPALRARALSVAQKLQIRVEEGVYAYCQGPSYETPAEIRALRLLGADAVGMSTVPEAICARHCGMDVLALSCITNFAAGILEQPLNHAEVLEVGKLVAEDSIRLLQGILEAGED